MATLGRMFGASDTSTFLGLPFAPDLSRVDPGIVILGAAGCTPYTSVGFYCAEGPAAIRQASAMYAANLGHMNFDLGGPVLPEGAVAVDAGNLDQVESDAEGNRSRIRAAIATLLDRGAVPFLLGGDDSVPIPMIQAFEGRGAVTILQIDAHIDWREQVDGERWGLSSTMRRASEMAHVERIIQIGQRGIGSARPGDYRAALDWGVHFVPAGEVARDGVWRAVDLIPEGADVIVCLDVDALDPAVMPAAIGRTAGGMSYWQVLELIGAVSEKARIAAFDMVELMPDRDIDGQGALTAAQLLASVMGLVARQQMREVRG
ncbi:MAG: arginase family protein [Paracoccaceae bacterium]